MYDIQEIRKDFPILGREVYGRPLVYLDNGATTQKPRCVVEAMTDEYYNVNANVHRGVHFLSQQATELHEAARETVRRFLNARSPAEIVFTRGTTESINLVASCFGEAFMREGDEVILSEMEHHSNIVSWQLLQARQGHQVAGSSDKRPWRTDAGRIRTALQRPHAHRQRDAREQRAGHGQPRAPDDRHRPCPRRARIGGRCAEHSAFCSRHAVARCGFLCLQRT